MHGIIEPLVPLAVPVDSLNLLPGNPRRGNVEAVARSLERFGQRKPVVVNANNGEVIAGNHTVEAAVSLGWDEVAAVMVDDDPGTAGAFALADNRTADLAGYDDAALAELVREVVEVDASLLESASIDLDDFDLSTYDDDDDEPLVDMLDGWGDSRGIPADKVRFRFGDYNGVVDKAVYDKFVLNYEDHRDESGAVVLEDVIVSWLGL